MKVKSLFLISLFSILFTVSAHGMHKAQKPKEGIDLLREGDVVFVKELDDMLIFFSKVRPLNWQYHKKECREFIGKHAFFYPEMQCWLMLRGHYQEYLEIKKQSEDDDAGAEGS